MLNTSNHADTNLGEVLVKLCEYSRLHNVDIRVRHSSFHPNAFEIQLDRKDHHAVETIDITRTFKDDPERAAEFVFNRALYNLGRMQ
jgi:hypothetical protein